MIALSDFCGSDRSVKYRLNFAALFFSDYFTLFVFSTECFFVGKQGGKWERKKR